MSSARMANVAGALVPGGAGGMGASPETGAGGDAVARGAWESMLSSIFVSVADPTSAAADPEPLAVLEAVVRAAGCDRVLVADPRRPRAARKLRTPSVSLGLPPPIIEATMSSFFSETSSKATR